MTKRSYNFNNNSNKKQKLEDDIDALWGDDLDESALDDCIKLATQRFEGENIQDNSLNISKIPTYNVFKEPEKIFSSTQFQSTCHEPSTSKQLPLSNKENINKDLEKDIQELRLKFQEKEGEVSILRSQLKETKLNFTMEQQKLQNEWKKKFVMSEKQIQSVKSALEFKTLEIVNLKQKLVEVSKKKFSSTFDTSLNDVGESKKIKLVSNKSTLSTNNDFCRLHAIVDTVYPLKDLDRAAFISLPRKEKYIMETKQIQSCRKAIPYLQNQHIALRHFVNKNDVNFEDIFTSIFKLINSSEQELNSSENISTIDKVIYASMHLLEDLYNFLQEIISNIRTEDILESDSIYIRNHSQFDNLNSCQVDEIGINAGIMLNFLAELLLYCDYMKLFIRSQNLINFKINDYSVQITGQQLLNKILDILKLSGEIRKADIMSVFLKSTVKLCINICKSGNYIHLSEIFCEFVKELIFSRPQISVVIQLTYLFKEASVYNSFVEFLFNEAKGCSSTKRGVVYFNNDACRFYIFVLMFDRCLCKLENVAFEVYMNMMCFIYNTYKTSYLIHHQNAKDCECLPHLYKLEIEIINRTLNKYLEFKKIRRTTSEWDYFFKTKIVGEILSLIMFHSYELTEKYITVFSRYREIAQLLMEDEINGMDKLNISEDIPEIASKSFDKLDF